MIIEKSFPAFVLLMLILISCLLTALGVNEYEPWITALLWTIGIVFFFICCLQTSSFNQVESTFFVLSLVVSISYIYIGSVGHNLRSSFVQTGDAYGFWTRAVQLWNGEEITRYTILPYILNYEFHIFDQNYLCCLLFNALFCELAIFNLVEYAGKKNAQYADLISIILACFFPFVFKIASSLWRESLYVLCLSFSFRYFIQFIETRKLSKLYIAAGLTIPVLLGHSGYFPIPLMYFIASLTMKDTKNRRNFGIFVLQMLILLVFVRIVMSFNSIEYITGGQSSDLDDFFVRIAGSDNSTAGSAYLVGLKATNVMQVILYAPIRLIFYLFSPLPMNWRGVRDIGTFMLDSMLHVLILYKALTVLVKYRLTNVYKTNEYQIVKWGFFCYIFVALVFAMGTKAAGTAIRHRDSVVPIELFVYINASYIERRFERNRISRIS